MPPAFDSLPLVLQGLFAIHDTGAPTTGACYHTLVILHGLGWHVGECGSSIGSSALTTLQIMADVFSRLVPLAAKSNCRLILINRRGYPGSTPLSAEQLSDLGRCISDTSSESLNYVKDFCQERGREVYDFLTDLVCSDESITPEGGLSVAGWSFGSIFTMALLANAPEFAVARNFDLQPYIHSVINYGEVSSSPYLGQRLNLSCIDPPHSCFGYPSPPGYWHPFVEPDTSVDDAITKLFPPWVSGYYEHNPPSYEFKHPLVNPRKTIETLPQSTMSLAAVTGGGSDILHFVAVGTHNAVASELRDAVLYTSRSGHPGDAWNDIPLKHVFCDHSMWTAVHCAKSLREEYEAAKKARLSIRPVEIVRIEGANHFVSFCFVHISLSINIVTLT